jgi:hypothetical protein
MVSIGPHLLGRTLEHDPRSRNYAFARKTVAKPVNRLWTSGPVLDQGDIGSCEGNTATEWLNSTVNAGNRAAFWKAMRYPGSPKAYLTETNAKVLYSAATRFDNDEIPGIYPPTDTGTSAVGIAKAMKAAGGITSYQWTFGWDHFLAAIDVGPVMLGTNWYSGMFDPNKQGYVEISGDLAGGHAYLGKGIDYKNQRVRCRNHWTKSWGPLGGEFYLSFKTLQRLLDEQGDVLIPVRI